MLEQPWASQLHREVAHEYLQLANVRIKVLRSVLPRPGTFRCESLRIC